MNIDWKEVIQFIVVGFGGIVAIFAMFALVAILTILFIAGVDALSCAMGTYQGLQCGPG